VSHRGFLLWFGLALVGLLALVVTHPTQAGRLQQPKQTPGSFVPLAEPQAGKFDQAAVAKIDLKTYPVVPTIPADHVLVIYQEGLRRGNNPRVFSKVGDCMTATPDFLEPIGKGDYELAAYSSLKSVIDVFAGVPARGKDAGFDSFTNPGLAATNGFNAAGVLDAIWADPKWCSADESPLTCEYRVSKPGIALIMFGTNDIKSIKPEEFDYYLRRVVVQTVNAGIVPVLSTFPMQPGLTDKSILYNQITARIATDYDVPLINLWLALDPLPHQGVDPENTTHMTKAPSGHSASFAEADLQAGYNVRNLVTLQTLEALLKVIQPDTIKEGSN
jgi:hypothetical protein